MRRDEKTRPQRRGAKIGFMSYDLMFFFKNNLCFMHVLKFKHRGYTQYYNALEKLPGAISLAQSKCDWDGKQGILLPPVINTR